MFHHEDELDHKAARAGSYRAIRQYVQANEDVVADCPESRALVLALPARASDVIHRLVLSEVLGGLLEVYFYRSDGECEMGRYARCGVDGDDWSWAQFEDGSSKHGFTLKEMAGLRNTAFWKQLPQSVRQRFESYALPDPEALSFELCDVINMIVSETRFCVDSTRGTALPPAYRSFSAEQDCRGSIVAFLHAPCDLKNGRQLLTEAGASLVFPFPKWAKAPLLPASDWRQLPLYDDQDVVSGTQHEYSVAQMLMALSDSRESLRVYRIRKKSNILRANDLLRKCGARIKD